MPKASLRVSNGSRLTRSKSNRCRERNPRNPMARKICVSDWSGRIHRSVEDKMKKAFMSAVLLLRVLSPLCSAQGKPKAEDGQKAEGRATPVKLPIGFTEFEGGQKRKS